MASMHCEPAAQIILTLGGLTEVAKVTKITLTTVQRWRLPVAKGGTGGYIPRKYHPSLIKHGKKVGVELSPINFVTAPSKGSAA